MPRAKRSSIIIEKAEKRLASIKSINPKLDLGKGVTVSTFAELIETTRRRVEAYNTSLSLVDADLAALQAAEKTLSDYTEKVLLGIAFEYGKDSPEYEMAGGTRKSQRKRPSRKVDDALTAKLSPAPTLQTNPS
jgi:hypothetical protein